MTIIEWDTVEGWVYDWLCMINNAFDTAMETLTISPFNSSITAVNTVMSAVEGVALVLVSLFFAMQLCNEAMLLKLQSYEQVFKVFFRFILAKVIVQNASALMGIIYNSFNGLAAGLVQESYGFLSSFETDAILSEPAEEGFMNLNYLVKYLEVMPTFLILMGACWVINLILIGRIFEIVVYTAVSPIPLATFAAEGWHDSAKAFLKSYAAVCLQGLVVVLMFYSFSQVIDLMGGSDKVGITIVALSLALGVAKSGQWARQAIGSG